MAPNSTFCVWWNISDEQDGQWHDDGRWVWFSMVIDGYRQSNYDMNQYD